MIDNIQNTNNQYSPLLITSTSSDNSYILRKMLRRGVEEAYYRYRLYEGDRAFDFKLKFYQLEGLIDELDSMLDDKGRIGVEHLVAIIQAIRDCQDLFALDYAETVADYRNLMADLTRDVCPECHMVMVAA